MFFFFSSRRRHTRWNCDWSSDVCSSDLAGGSWMSFRHLTSGERKRLQQGILSPEEATKVSIRAGEKAAASPDLGTQILGGVRLVAKGVASFYGAGGLVENVEKIVGGPTPTQQLGLTPIRSRGGPAPALP